MFKLFWFFERGLYNFFMSYSTHCSEFVYVLIFCLKFVCLCVCKYICEYLLHCPNLSSMKYKKMLKKGFKMGCSLVEQLNYEDSGFWHGKTYYRLAFLKLWRCKCIYHIYIYIWAQKWIVIICLRCTFMVKYMLMFKYFLR